MKKYFLTILRSVLCLLLTSISINCFAQFEEGSKFSYSLEPPMIGASIAVDSTRTIVYDNEGASSRKIKNIISLIFKEDSTFVIPSGFTATVTFTLETKATPAASVQTQTKSLTVNYDTATGSTYNVRSYIVLDNEAEEVKITVTNVSITGNTGWDPIGFLQLENELTGFRYYLFDGSQAATSFGYSNTLDELKANWSWPANTNNNVSQIEWAWVENEMLGYYQQNGVTNYNYLFSNNSTRVDLDYGVNEYKIPLLYDGAGKVYYRVRSAYRKNNGSTLLGIWSGPQEFSFSGHNPNLNWQSSTTYAENGKRKTVIQYFDGISKSRQTVTKDNTTGNTVVAETIYDLQGRPNIQILPTPTIDNAIQYFADFNRFIGQNSTDTDPANIFDLTPKNVRCNRASALDSSKGNGRYYSNQNDWLTGVNAEAKSKYIPDAQGFGFTETRFYDDATQRVRSQGGVGITHQIGDGHDTKYYYGKPSQPELDALFGTEVGDASHYSKNMVKDANGQMSVSYVDMHGRTIATALAGDPPSNLVSIKDNLNSNGVADYPEISGQITDKLVTPLTNVIKGNSIEAISTILVPATTEYNFSYALDPAIFSQTSCTNQQICFDCKYDVEFTIKSEDECADTPLLVKKYSNLTIAETDQCTTSIGFIGEGISTATKQISFAQTLLPGSYVVRKTLTINDSLFAIRRDSALKVFLCKEQQTIEDSIFSALQTISGCGATEASVCDSCTVNLGTYTSYKNKYLTGIGRDITFTGYDAAIRNQFIEDSVACANACGGFDPKFSTLYDIRQQMLNDMIPYTGQYALPVDTIVAASGGLNRLEAKYNIFTTTYGGTTKQAFYKYPKESLTIPGDYLTEQGQIDITIAPTGSHLDRSMLDTIGVDPYLNLFQPSWANSLIYYHPEYRKLKYAEDTLVDCYTWLDKVMACESYQEALTKGYTTPLNSDPFFVNNYSTNDETTMDRYLTQNLGNPFDITNPSIWQIANSSAKCADIPNIDATAKEACLNTCLRTGIDPTIDDEYKDSVWDSFKGLYLTYRNDMVVNHINAHIQAQLGGLTIANANTLKAEDKILAFATLADVAQQNKADWFNNILVTNNTNSATNGLDTYLQNNGYGSNVTNAIANNTDKCNGQRPIWKARLLQCDSLIKLLEKNTQVDSNTVNIIINKILDSLVMVCQASTDAAHPYGATTRNPNISALQYISGGGTSSNPISFYQNDFNTSPYSHPYTLSATMPNSYVSNSSWTNTQNVWDNYNSNSGQGKALAIPSASPDSTTLSLQFDVAPGKYLTAQSVSFLNRSSVTGYALWTMYVNDNNVASGNINVSSSATQISTGTVNFSTTIPPLTGNVIIKLVLKGGSHGGTGTFRFDNFILNGYVQEQGGYSTNISPFSFETVVNNVFNQYGINTLPGNHYYCNPFSIDEPGPYTGINLPLTTNYNSTIDSCGCSRFASLKQEANIAGYDTLSYVSMNTFFNVNYQDTLTNVLWIGLQKCNEIFKDSCTYIYQQTGSSMNYSYRPLSNLLTNSNCVNPVVFSPSYLNSTSVNNVKVYYNCNSVSTAVLTVKSSITNNVLQTVPLSCDSNYVILSLPLCDEYTFKIGGYADTCGTITNDNVAGLVSPVTCTTCTKPTINYAKVLLPNPNVPDYGMQDVKINYTIPSGAVNANIRAYSGNGLFNSWTENRIDYTDTVVTIPDVMATCTNIYFVARYNIVVNDVCTSVVSDTLLLDSCWTSSCSKIYSPIYLTDVVPIPQFLNCGFTKPCITCSQLDAYVEEFRQLYPAYAAAPYMDSIITESMSEQNNLLARFINYRTGFSKTTVEYLAAYAACHTPNYTPPIYALCASVKPINDPGSYYVAKDPCADTRTQAQYAAQLQFEMQKQQLIANFDSAYMAKCLTAKYTEQFTVSYTPKEYHYTLYAYDQAGNLVKTLPPAAVRPNYDPAYLNNVAINRANGNDYSNPNNIEALKTQYAYNSLNQLVQQSTPDAGTSKFWYDRLGRLVISQNEKQSVVVGGQSLYSYTLYDALGRIIEVGEKPQSTPMLQSISQDTTQLKDWLAATGTKKQITHSVYDTAYTPIATTNPVTGICGLYQQNLRNRVSYTYLKNTEDSLANLWDAATFYSYDIHGNVDTLLQDYRTGMGSITCQNDANLRDNRFKKISYYYDLISGKVNEVAYQAGQKDQFYHQYEYDAENRITEVKSSRDKIYWEREANYDYYRHGPLSRSVIGQNQVQGIDYAYTLQGWLKGINGAQLNTGGFFPTMVSEGNPTSSDAYALMLGYYNGDYKPIGVNATAFNKSINTTNSVGEVTNLYNGNISYNLTSLYTFDLSSSVLYGNGGMLYAYQYDQLNRLTKTTSQRDILGVNLLGNNGNSNILETISYDPNGNIRSLMRNAKNPFHDYQLIQMDSLVYHYDGINVNKLKQVTDNIGNTYNYGSDIDNQANANNYEYDAIGNLIKDVQGGIDSIYWNVYGKISRIKKTNSVIEYKYDAAGQRISKTVVADGKTNNTYYVRDASGNIMSVYSKVPPLGGGGVDTLFQTSIDLYGSSRLGTYTVKVNVQNCMANTDTMTTFTRGNKQYELTNQVGNVMVTVSGKKIYRQIAPPPSGCTYCGATYSFVPDVVTASDMYPGGMLMPGRIYPTPISEQLQPVSGAGTASTPVTLYQHTFNDTPSVHPYYTPAPTQNSNITNSKWTNSKGVWTSFNSSTVTYKHTLAIDGLPSNSATNTTITLEFDVAAGKTLNVTSYSFMNRGPLSGYPNYTIAINGTEIGNGALHLSSSITMQSAGGNVTNPVNNLAGHITVTLTLSGSHSSTGTFRMDNFTLNGYLQSLPGVGSGGNTTDKAKYPYTINGQMRSDEIAVNTTTAEFWEYDIRIVRRWNVDPVVKNWESPYLVFGANPITNADPRGDDWIGRKNSDGSYSAHWDKKYTKNSKLAKNEFYIGASSIIIGTDNKAYVLQTDGNVTLWQPPVVSKPIAVPKEKGILIPDGAGIIPETFNYSKAQVAAWREQYANYKHKGITAGLEEETIKRYDRWIQADKDYRTMSYAVVAAFMAPLAIESGVVSSLAQLTRSGLQYGFRTYGRDFLINTTKQYFSNEGDASKIDWFDVSVSTLNPFRKYGNTSSFVNEAANSLFDFKGGQFRAAFYNKTSSDVMIDFGIGQVKALGKTSFNMLGGIDQSRDYFFDIGIGVYKTKVKSIIGK